LPKRRHYVEKVGSRRFRVARCRKGQPQRPVGAALKDANVNLYHLHELNLSAFGPARLAAEAQLYIIRNPNNPFAYTPPGRAYAAALELFEAQLRPYGKPEFDLPETTIDGEPVKVEEEIVERRPFCDLLHFRRDTERQDPRVLIVAPLSGHYATLLRGTVEAMLPEHDVYVTDWHDARQIPLMAGPFDLDDYIDYVVGFLQTLGPGAHVMGVCQPAVPVLAATALMNADNNPAAPRSMVLMGGPIDTRENPTVPNKLAKSRSLDWFEHSVVNRVPAPYPGFYRRVYPGFLQLTGFMTMNLDRHVGAHMRLYQHLIRGDGDSAEAHRTFYNEYRAVMDLPAEYYLQTIAKVFQEHLLPRGAFDHRGHVVEPQAIDRTALMTVEGERDDISGVGQTRAAHKLLTAIPGEWKVHHEQPKVGHYGVFNGRRWRQEIYPKVAAFIRQHDRRRK